MGEQHTILYTFMNVFVGSTSRKFHISRRYGLQYIKRVYYTYRQNESYSAKRQINILKVLFNIKAQQKCTVQSLKFVQCIKLFRHGRFIMVFQESQFHTLIFNYITNMCTLFTLSLAWYLNVCPCRVFPVVCQKRRLFKIQKLKYCCNYLNVD